MPTDDVHYSPDAPTEADLRLLGDLRNRRVLELGCADPPASVAFAARGAVAIAVDASAERLEAARGSCEAAGVRVEFHRGDPADLAFLRADSIDLAFSALTLAEVDDLNRLFRQVHRVLRTNAPLVFSLPHPAYDMIDDASEEPLRIRRSYFDRGPLTDASGDTRQHRRLADLFTALVRANFRVDTLLEPEPARTRSADWREAALWVPRTLIIRARKEGV